MIGACQNSNDEELIKHTQIVNKGMEELIMEKLQRFNAISVETNLLVKQKIDANFYYDNTYFLLNPKNKESDSLIFWRLTKSVQANQYGFHSSLDSNIVFSKDSLRRKTALLFNLNEYTNHLFGSFSYCGVKYGSIPTFDPNDSNKIYLHGTPSEGTELFYLVKYTDQMSEGTLTMLDTTPVWATLTIHPN